MLPQESRKFLLETMELKLTFFTILFKKNWHHFVLPSLLAITKQFINFGSFLHKNILNFKINR